MDINNLKQEIERIERSTEEMNNVLESKRQQLIDAIKPFAKEKIKSEVENQVRTNADHTKALGKDVLSEMKRQLTAVLENSDEIVEKVFSDETIWVHVNYRIIPGEGYSQKYNNTQKARDNIMRGLQLIVGEAGKILFDNKYISLGRQYQWEHGMPYDYTRANQGQSRIIYGYRLSLPKSIEEMIDNYCKGIGELHEILEKLSAAKKKLAEQEAADLWDEV